MGATVYRPHPSDSFVNRTIDSSHITMMRDRQRILKTTIVTRALRRLKSSEISQHKDIMVRKNDDLSFDYLDSLPETRKTTFLLKLLGTTRIK